MKLFGFHHSCYSWIGSNLWCALAFRKSISLYTVYGCTVCIHKHIHMKYSIYLHMHLRVSTVFTYGMYIVPYVYTPMISYAFFFLTCTYSPAKHYSRGIETLVFVPAFCQPAWLLGQKRNRWAAEWLGPAGTILGQSFYESTEQKDNEDHDCTKVVSKVVLRKRITLSVGCVLRFFFWGAMLREQWILFSITRLIPDPMFAFCLPITTDKLG